MTRRGNPENKLLEPRVRALLADGLSQSRIAKHLGVTRSRISHIIHYHVTRSKVPTFDKPFRGQYTETHLTEPWKKFTARKKAERAAAKASLSAVALTGQDSD